MSGLKLYPSILALLSALSVHCEQQDSFLSEGPNCFGQIQEKIAGLSKDRSRGYVKGDFLYLVPYEGGLEYAFSQSSPETPGVVLDLALTPTVQKGHFNRIESMWLPGFRLEAGGHLPVDDWYAYAKWTRITGVMSSSTSIASLGTANIAAIWLGGGYASSGYERALHAVGTWNLHYNVANLALVRRYFSKRELLLSIHSGLQGAIVNQQFRADYSGGTITTVPTFFKGKINFQSLGLFSECDMSWCIAKGWRVLGNLLGSINFGSYQLKQQILAAITDSLFTLPYSLHDVLDQKENRTRFAYEANLGIEWSYPFNNGSSISLNAMYNLVEWLDLNQLRRFIFSDGFEDRYFYSTNGNLSFQGISAALGIGF